MPDERPLGTVLVTGGSSGLGAAVAAAVEEAGGHRRSCSTASRHPTAFAYEQVDLARPREAEAAVARAAERAGGLDAVVTAAGTDACGDIGDVDADAWDRVVAGQPARHGRRGRARRAAAPRALARRAS